MIQFQGIGLALHVGLGLLDFARALGFDALQLLLRFLVIGFELLAHLRMVEFVEHAMELLAARSEFWKLITARRSTSTFCLVS